MARNSLTPISWLCALGLALIVPQPARAGLVVLYDGTQQAVTPNNFSPQWLTFASIGGSQTYSAGSSATNYNSSASQAIQGGYSNYLGTTLINPQFPQLDRSAGYRLSFTVEMLAESHTSDQRAGFSVVALSSDVSPGMTAGIEVGFQVNRIFAQNDNPLFGSPVAETSTFNPVGVGFVNYDLTIQGTTYSLTANQQLIMSGALRDYTSFAGIPDVYEIPNFIFLGDNTTSAAGNINLRSVSVETFAAVPEPSALGCLCLLAAGLAARRLRRRQSFPPSVENV